MPFIKKGVVIPKGTGTEIDALFAAKPCILYIHGLLYCYYSGTNSAGTARICLAISENGISFNKLGAVITPTSGASDASGCDKSSVILYDGLIWLFYSGWVGSKFRICIAVSEDGIHFTKLGVSLPLGNTGSSDNLWISSAWVAENSGRIHLYYMGVATGITQRIHLALSENGINFIKLGIILTVGSLNTIDYDGALEPSLIYQEGIWRLYYVGRLGTEYRDCLAISESGINFTRMGVVIPLGGIGETDSSRVYQPDSIYVDGLYSLYYVGFLGSAYRICLAISESGL